MESLKLSLAQAVATAVYQATQWLRGPCNYAILADYHWLENWELKRKEPSKGRKISISFHRGLMRPLQVLNPVLGGAFKGLSKT